MKAKKSLALLLTLVMILSLAPVQAFAEDPTISITLDSYDLPQSDVDRTIKAHFILSESLSMAAVHWTVSFGASNPGTLTFSPAVWDDEEGDYTWKEITYWRRANNGFDFNPATGIGTGGRKSNNYTDNEIGYCSIVIPANAPAGTYTINLSDVYAQDISGTKLFDDGSATVTFTINSPAATYAVNYLDNAGSDPVTGMPSSQTKTEDEALTLSSATPTRDGFTFTGWNTQADGSGTPYAAGASYTDNAALNLYAQWTASTVANVDDAQFELYYELYDGDNAATDADTSGDPGFKYMDYDAGDTVTAKIYLKSTNYNPTLQAYDLYITNSPCLTRDTVTVYDARGALVNDASNALVSTSTLTHIQAIGNDTTALNIAMTKDTALLIATVTYTFNTSGTYIARQGEQYPITINTTGNKVTVSGDEYDIISNIAIATTKKSFVPTIGDNQLGAEIITTYTVTYDENKPAAASALTVTGMPAPNPDTKGYNVAYTVAAAPSLANYTFAGWNTAADGSGTPYAAAASYTANADVTLYAQWTPDTHKVEWKSQDGNSTLETDPAVAYGATLSYDGTTPTKAADAQYTYTFAGWSASQNAETGAAANTFTMGDADMVLYAAFSKVTNEYTVTWKSQDGNTTYETDANVLYGTAPSYDSTTPTKDADATYTYTFADWATTTGAESGTAVASLPTVSGNATYYAAFSKTYIDYTVSYALGDHAADGETAPASETKHNGETVTLPAGPAAADGYEFTGWSDGTNTYNAGDTYTISGAGATMTAQYAEKTYTVAYAGNGNTGGSAPASHTSQSFTADFTAQANTFEKTGYTFNGWNTKADGSGTPVTAGNVYKISTLNLDSATLAGTTVTLYAQWVRESDYAITYELNGGTVATANPTAYNVDTPTFTLNNPTKTGYTFKGWSGTGLTGDENTTVTIAQGSTGARSYEAHWTPAPVNYTVEHYKENLDGSYPATPTETETLTANTESTVIGTAKTYTGFTYDNTVTGTVASATVAPDGSTTLRLYYTRNTHTVTYQYTNDPVPTGATALPAQQTGIKYGQTFNVSTAEVTAPHYDWSGWSITGEQTMGDEDVVITGTFTEHSYTIKFWNLENGETGNTVLSEQTYTESTQGSITVPSVPAKTWYDPNGWTSYTLFSAEEINVYPQYTEHVYTITFQDKDGNNLPDQGSDNTFTKTDSSITPPEVPARPGYTGTWPTLPTSTPADASVQPVYTPISYTITFVTDGGTAISAMTYNIESTDALPSASGKTNFSFVNWKVTTADGNWAADSTINGGTVVTGKYGNVTLTAQWTQSLVYAVEDYKYAPTGYKMLIIDAAGADEGKVYTYDGATMYYTTDDNYMIGTGDNKSTAVFYTLIACDALTLTDEQVGKIATSAGTRATITYDGDVNGDGVVNIADANTIFQMLKQSSAGGYYSIEHLSIAQRLAADMVKATNNAEYRGSIEDVNAVVAIINGTTT